MKTKILLIKAVKYTFKELTDNIWLYLVMALIPGFVLSMISRVIMMFFQEIIESTPILWTLWIFFATDLYFSGVFMSMIYLSLANKNARHSIHDIFYFIHNMEEFFKFYKTKLLLIIMSLPYFFMIEYDYKILTFINYIKQYIGINILVSNSRPGDRPKYEWVGLAKQ